MSKIDITISQRLKDCRKLKKLSLEAAAKEIGVTKQTLIDYEAGRGNPSLTTVQLICRAYEISPNFLIAGNDDNVSKMVEPLKRKAYLLLSLIIDEDLIFNQLDYSIHFKNQDLRSIVSRCHAIWSSRRCVSKLESIDTLLRYLKEQDSTMN